MKEKPFGQVLRELRVNHKEFNSLREFAKKVGLSPAYLSRIENQKEPPPSEAVIEKLAEALGADKYELFGCAGKVPSEFLETFRKNPKSMASFMRRVQEAGVESDQEWKRLETSLHRMKRGKRDDR
jgi:transcriptional regulator with XRE-family HTH domain